MTLIEDAEFITDQIVESAVVALNEVIELLVGSGPGYQAEEKTERQQVVEFAETITDPWGMARFADSTYRRLLETAAMLPEDTRVREGFDDRGLRMLAALLAAQYAGKMRKLAADLGIDLPLLPIVLPPQPPPVAAPGA